MVSELGLVQTQTALLRTAWLESLGSPQALSRHVCHTEVSQAGIAQLVPQANHAMRVCVVGSDRCRLWTAAASKGDPRQCLLGSAAPWLFGGPMVGGEPLAYRRRFGLWRTHGLRPFDPMEIQLQGPLGCGLPGIVSEGAFSSNPNVIQVWALPPLDLP